MSSSTSPRILLLGGFGYIGSKLYSSLKKEYNIVRSSVRIANLKPIIGFDMVLNCAGRKPGKDVTRAQMVEDNVIATAQLSKLFSHSAARLIHISSMSVFNLSSWYGMTKGLAETHLRIEFVRTDMIRLPRVVPGEFRCNFSFTKGIHKVWTAQDIGIGIENIPQLIRDVIGKPPESII